MSREYFCAYHSYMESLKAYSDAEKGRLFMACLQYSMTGIEPELFGNERFIWPTMRMNIDRDAANYSSKCEKNRANASERKRTQANASEPERSPAKASETQRIAEDKDKDKEEDKDKDKDKLSSSKRFVPPTLEEVKAYCAENGLTTDPKQFYDYFTVGNWIDSKGAKVRNWKQKLLTWEKMNPGARNTPAKKQGPSQSDYAAAAAMIAKMKGDD